MSVEASSWEGVEPPVVQILVVVANTRARLWSADAERGSTSTRFGRG